ncbi:M20/M25/M40 family metallo-hydrolase [Kocuria atrinae]|uniref:M20/M25/M40 family metallo-hydrolase n=1 Tax=Kocuria atrinae TaxID=592377 RepID=UPI0037BFF769
MGPVPRRCCPQCDSRVRFHGRDHALPRRRGLAPGRWPAGRSGRTGGRPYGVTVDLEHIRGVPPVVNGETETTLLEIAARAELGEDSVMLVEQSMGGEDFAWFLQHVPGAMMRLGTRLPAVAPTTCTSPTTLRRKRPSAAEFK